MTPCLLARRVSAWTMAQGAPTAAVPGDSQGRGPDPQPSPTPHAKGLGQYNLSRKGATNPMAMLRPCPHTHRDTDTPLAWLSPSWSWCRQQPQAGAGGGPDTAAPELVGPVGWRGWDKGQGRWDWDGSTSCLQVLAGGDMFPRARLAVAPMGPSPPASRHQGPRCLATATARIPQPHGEGDPQMGDVQGLGEPLTLQAHTWGSVPPPDQGLKARALHGDMCPPPSHVPAPSVGRAAVPAARRDALN